MSCLLIMILLFIFWINFFFLSLSSGMFCFCGTTSFFFHDIFFSFSFFDTLLLRHKSRKTSCWWIQKKQQYHIEIILRLFFLSFYLKVGRSEEVFSFFSNLQKYEPNQCTPTFPIRLKSWGTILKTWQIWNYLLRFPNLY